MKFLYTTLVVILFSSVLIAQSDYSEIIHQERFSIGAGIGYEYGIVGVRGAYLLNKSFSVIGTLSNLPKAGVEYRAHGLFKNPRIMPYLNLQFGATRDVTLSCDAFALDLIICESPRSTLERKIFLGPTVGLGMKYKLFKKFRGYGSIGINYNNVCPVQEEDFVRDFNKAHGADRTIIRKNAFSFSIGYTYLLKSTDPEYKK